jgi:hypothetical protein
VRRVTESGAQPRYTLLTFWRTAAPSLAQQDHRLGNKAFTPRPHEPSTAHAAIDAQEDTNMLNQHLDVLCDEGYRAISCEADIAGQNSYDYDRYYVSLNELTPQGFKANKDGAYVHASSDATYWGCHIRANNNLLYFTPSHHPQYGYDFAWKIAGFATCVPKDCVEVYETHTYHDEYVDPIDY